MKMKRREFLQKSAITGCLAGLGINELIASPDKELEFYQSAHIEVEKPKGRIHYEPLEQVRIHVDLQLKKGEIRITDGQGNTYHTSGFQPDFSFQVAGALGYHIVSVHNTQSEILDWTAFPVDCQTKIEDEQKEFSDFMDILYKTLNSSYAGRGHTVRYNQKYYTYYSSWLQDHVFVADAQKYFVKDIKTGIDLYADAQRNDGLIWDNYKHPYPERQSYWEYRFDYGGFTYRPEDPRSTAIFVRIPVENIGEHTFIEGLYYAWRATGDTEWMKGRLDNALKAVKFATSSPYYWSEEKKLLKRPFTIDRWDFQSDFDVEISETGNDFMGVNLGKTHYGIMFGDNTCMANACELLSEMLAYTQRKEEAEKMKQLSQSLWKRINALSWRGNFYQHWYSLQPGRNIDFGVDTTKQVTLSNAMALLRGLDHDKCVKIIQTYQQIRKEMPESSPGEWYLCYPPFEKGWHINKWEYMNGGVSSITAGDLALGAFEHGFEWYATDILRRLYQLSKQTGYTIKGAYKGKIAEEPQRNFITIDIKQFANTDLVAHKQKNETDWIGGEEADFRNLPLGTQKLAGVLFAIIDPAKNKRKSCIAISRNKENKGAVNVPVAQKARSIYLLHTTDSSSIAGTLFIRYNDDTFYARYINSGDEIGHFWYPTPKESRKGIPKMRIAWRGPAKVVQDIGIYAFGMDNPHPDKTIRSIEFVNPQEANWVIFGITLSDAPHYFKPDIVSTIPNHWGAAHVIKAVIEGLAGIKNTGVAFDKVVLSPRWDTAGINKVKATAKYESSGGYLAYAYKKQTSNQYEIEFTGNSKETEFRFLLPKGKNISKMLVNEKTVKPGIQKIEGSTYATIRMPGIGLKKVQINIR